MKPIPDFVLIDLYMQRNEVTEYVKGWSREEILEWMQYYGEIKAFTDTHYIFWSQIDRNRTVFRFDQDGTFIIETSGWYYQ